MKWAKLIKALDTKRKAELAKAEAVLAVGAEEDRVLTDEEQKAFDGHMASAEEFDAGIANYKKMQNQEALAPVVIPADVAGDGNASLIDNSNADNGVEVKKKIIVPQNCFPMGSLRAFPGADSTVRAYRAGRFYMAAMGHGPSQRFCQEHGIALQRGAVQEETVNTTGGYLVPSELDRDIIELINFYGTFRGEARIKRMTTDVVKRPRRTGGLTATFVGESEAGTESTKTWDQVTLTAKKLMVLSRISSELQEDAIIDVANDLTIEISRAFAQKEDECGYVGTGTAAFGGIVGVSTAISNLNGVTASGGMLLHTGNTQAEMTLAEFNALQALLPDFADANAKWFCHKKFFYGVMVLRLAAAGGNTIETLQNGDGGPKFLGDPVVFTNTMPNTDGNSQIDVMYGDLSLAADFGDRRQRTIQFSNDATIGGENVFERDQIAVKGTERFDINAHDVGTASLAGPMVASMSEAS